MVLADGSFVTASAKRERGPLLGAARRRRQLRRGDELPVPGASGEHGLCRADLLGRQARARRSCAAYRDFLPTAPEELGIFVGLKTVPSMDPFPHEPWGKRACAIIGAFNGSEEDGKKALAPLLDKLPEPIFNWMSADALPGDAGAVRRVLPEGAAVVLEGRLRDGALRRGDRRPRRRGGEGAERALLHAPLSDRRRRPTGRQGRDGVGCAGRELVDGHRGDRSRSAAGRAR